MRNTIKLIGIIALAAAIGLSFAACGDGAGGGDSGPAPETYTSTGGGNTYVLTISKAAKAANGDAYTLTVSGSENGRSTGTITVSGGTYTLTPGNNSGTLTVTIGGGGMTNISGTVTYDGGGSMTNPGALSPVTSGGGGAGSLVGTWHGAFVYPDDPTHPDNMGFTFNADGTFIMIDAGYVKGTYSVSGDKLTMTATHISDDGNAWLTIAEYMVQMGADEYYGVPVLTYKVNGSALTFTYKDDKNRDVTGAFTKQ